MPSKTSPSRDPAYVREYMRTRRENPALRAYGREAAKRWRAEHLEQSKEKTRDYMRVHRSDPQKRGKIYFIQAASGPIKIGFTSKLPSGRLLELQPGNHEELILLAWKYAERSEEIELHEKFASLSLRREWFRPDKILLDYIEQVKNSQPIPTTT